MYENVKNGYQEIDRSGTSSEVNRLKSQLGIFIDDHNINPACPRTKGQTVKAPTLAGGISNNAPSSSKVMLL